MGKTKKLAKKSGSVVSDVLNAIIEGAAEVERNRIRAENQEIAAAKMNSQQFRVGDVVRIDRAAAFKNVAIGSRIGVIRKIKGSNVWVKPNSDFAPVAIFSDVEIERV